MMTLEIVVESIEASNAKVELKGWSLHEDGRRKGYSIVSFDGGIDIPKLGSVMVLDVTFKAPETKFEPQTATDATPDYVNLSKIARP